MANAHVPKDSSRPLKAVLILMNVAMLQFLSAHHQWSAPTNWDHLIADVQLAWLVMQQLDVFNLMSASLMPNVRNNMHAPWIHRQLAEGAKILAALPSALKKPLAKPSSISHSAPAHQDTGVTQLILTLGAIRQNVKPVKSALEIVLVMPRICNVLVSTC